MTVSMLSNFAEGLAHSAVSFRIRPTGTSNSSKSTTTPTKNINNSNSHSCNANKKRPLSKSTSTSKATITTVTTRFKLTPSVTVIQDYVERVVGESSLLKQSNTMVQCSRSSLSVGKVIGEGSFSQVCTVRVKTTSNSNKQQSQQSNQVMKQLHPKLFVTTVTTNSSSKSSTSTTTSTTMTAQKALDQAAADLLLEALYLSSLQHPHIVSVTGLSSQPYHDLFVCLEHLLSTLAEKIASWKRQALPPRSLLPTQLSFACQVASAMSYLHTHRILLRDLKPDNIGIASDGTTVKLLDFGLCRELPPVSTSLVSTTTTNSEPMWHMTQVGTMRYCAGEILLGQAYNTKCDVYSFAIVLYELVTLQTAFPTMDVSSEASRQDHLERVCRGGKRPGLALYQLPENVERVIRKSWQRSIPKRWTSHQVHEALQSIVEKL